MSSKPNYFPAFDPQDGYKAAIMLPTDAEGRYRSTCIELAIRKDDADAIMEAVTLGWLAPQCRTLFNQTVPDYCATGNANKCEAKLREYGF